MGQVTINIIQEHLQTEKLWIDWKGSLSVQQNEGKLSRIIMKIKTVDSKINYKKKQKGTGLPKSHTGIKNAMGQFLQNSEERII